MKILLAFLTALFVFTGCSQKKYFEVEETVGSFSQPKKEVSSNIVSFTRDGATLEDGNVITKDGVKDFKLPENYSFINYSEDKIIATNNKNKILIGNSENIIDVDGIVVAATIKDHLLAMVFSNNTLAVYDIEENKYIYKDYMSESLVNDVRIANPIFMTNIILFPTLDGKVVVVGIQERKSLKNIVVDANGTFNNIIFLDVVNDTLIAATANKVVSVGTSNVDVENYEIRDIISNGKNIYIATIDGQLIKMDSKLNILGEKKYKFAKIYALAFGTSLYALESQGYVINVDEDFVNDRIFDFSFDEKSKAIGLKNRFYFEDEYVEVQ